MFHVKHCPDMVLFCVPWGREPADPDGPCPLGTQTHRRPFDTPLARLLRVRRWLAIPHSSLIPSRPEGPYRGTGAVLGHRHRRLYREPAVRRGGELSSIPGGRPGHCMDLLQDLQVPVLPADPSKLRTDPGQAGLHRGAGNPGGGAQLADPVFSGCDPAAPVRRVGRRIVLAGAPCGVADRPPRHDRTGRPQHRPPVRAEAPAGGRQSRGAHRLNCGKRPGRRGRHRPGNPLHATGQVTGGRPCPIVPSPAGAASGCLNPRAPGFAEACRRQTALAAAADRADAGLMRFVDAALEDLGSWE